MSQEIIVQGKVHGQFSKSDCACCEGNHHRFSTYIEDVEMEPIDFPIEIHRAIHKLPHGTKVKIIIETEDA